MAKAYIEVGWQEWESFVEVPSHKCLLPDGNKPRRPIIVKCAECDAIYDWHVWADEFGPIRGWRRLKWYHRRFWLARKFFNAG